MELNKLLNKDGDFMNLFNEWKKDEFGKSPSGFDLEKIEGAKMFCLFLKQKTNDE